MKTKFHEGISAFVSGGALDGPRQAFPFSDDINWRYVAESHKLARNQKGRILSAAALRKPLPVRPGDTVVLLWSPRVMGSPLLVGDLERVSTLGGFLERIEQLVVNAKLHESFAPEVYQAIGNFLRRSERLRLVERFEEVERLCIADLVEKNAVFVGQLSRTEVDDGKGVWTYEVY